MSNLLDNSKYGPHCLLKLFVLNLCMYGSMSKMKCTVGI
jgi:hypothetical protein